MTVVPRPTNDKLQEQLGGDDQGFGGDDDNSDDNSSAASPAAGGLLGMAVQPLTPGIARAVGVEANTQGVVIASVDNGSDAFGKLKRGDVILSVNANPVKTAADVDRLVQAAKTAGRPQVLLQVKRGRGNAAFLPVKIKS